MAVRTYEGMFILDSNRFARDPQGAPQEIHDMIAKQEGEVLVSRLWEERRLAYPINGNRKGTYWLTYLKLDTQRVGEFNREAQLNNAIIRHMLVKIDPRLVDTLVAHARGELTEEEGEGDEASAETATASS